MMKDLIWLIQFLLKDLLKKDEYIKKYLIKAKKDEIFFDKDQKNEVKEI